MRLEGEAIPASGYLIADKQRLKMETLKNGEFSYTFEKLQQNFSFQIEAAGFYSAPFTIKIVNRPELLDLKVQMQFPKYTGRASQEITNAGNLEVPEGTRIKWRIQTSNTQQASILFGSNPVPEPIQQSDNQLFELAKGLFNPDEYSIILQNENGSNKGKTCYRIDMIRDQDPGILLEHFRNSVLFKSILLGKTIQHD